MTNESLCGHVKALIREWVMERMDEKNQNGESERRDFVIVFLNVCVYVPFLFKLCFFVYWFSVDLVFISDKTISEMLGITFKYHPCCILFFWLIY